MEKSENINLVIPVIALGSFIGYNVSGKKAAGAIIGGIATVAVLFYLDMKWWNNFASEGPEEEIVPEYEILNDE